MRMLPATTFSPPKRFTPRRRPAESRPLREEPPAFLCAMAVSPLSLRGLRRRTAGHDLLDLDDGVVLAVAAAALGILPAALLEHENGGRAAMPDNFSGNAGARNKRAAQSD